MRANQVLAEPGHAGVIQIGCSLAVLVPSVRNPPTGEARGKPCQTRRFMAGPEGIEPPTRGLGVPCSIH
jgi:hypothetical protein